MKRYNVVFDRSAADDLASIQQYIAEARDAAFAHAFIDRAVAYCEGLKRAPHRGTRRDSILPGLRTVGWRRTLTVAFRVSDDDRMVVVLGVFYRGRDVLSALRQQGL